MREQFAGQVCVACGLGEQLELHHIVPRSQSGDDVQENLAVLCRSCHTKLEAHFSGWERVAASVRVYVLTSRERCGYMKSKMSWERFSNRYPLLAKPEGGTSYVELELDTPSGFASDWEHWEAPDERQSPWDIAYEPTDFREG